MIEKHNFHWKEGFFYNFPKKRKLFSKLVGEVKSQQIISLIGLRRTGKTTILKQLIDYLIQKRVKRESIIFYSFDESQPKVADIIQDYESRVGKTVLETKERVYIFLDEIQKLKNWQNQIKYYYDSYRNIKFFVSGSSSLFIKKQTRESLAGRIYEFILEPLSFEEFLIFRNMDDLLKKPGLLQDSIKNEFLRYQKRQFIEIVNETKERTANYTKSIVEKIVYQDIPKIFPVDQEELLVRILKIVASNPGLMSNYESLSQELGINRVTVSNYFFYLEESFLVKKLYNFSKNMLTSEKKMKKFYLTSTSFFPFLNDDVNEAKLIENLIVAATNARFFWRTPQNYEVDVVLDEKGKITPIEVKYRQNIAKKDLKNIVRFCKKFSLTNAVVITKDILKQERVEKINIRFIPAWRFLLKK